MEFWRYYRIIRKRRWLIILGMVICVGAVAIHNMTTQPLYTGRTTVMESKGMAQEGVPIYPEPYMQLDVQLRLSNLANIATSQRVLNNASVTLDDLGLKISASEILAHTSVEPVRDTNILAIEVTLPDPIEAKTAADVISSEFKRAYAELNNAALGQSREFVEAQVKATKAAMIEAQQRLKEYKEQNEIVMLDQQSLSAIQRASQAKVDVNTATAGLQAAHARVVKIEKELANIPEWQTVNEVTSRDPVWQRLSDDLVRLEAEKASMMNGGPGQQRRGPNHPDVQNIQRRIDEVKAKFASGEIKKDYISSSSEARNANYQNALDRWLDAKINEVSFAAQREATESVLAEMREEMATLPAQQAKLAELEMDVKAATETYGLMRIKLDEAKIREQQAKNEVALKTVDPAYVYPVNQRKMLKLVLAFLLSPLLGIGVAFLLHYTDNTIKSPTDAEKLVGLPVLSALPAARGHSLPRQRCAEIVEVAHQMLTSSLWIANQNQGVSAIAVVSAEPDAGRSVVASNVATALAREGARVILVDADLRQPTQHLIFGIDNKVGLTNVIGGAALLEDALQPTRVEGLLLVPSGPIPDNPVKFLRSIELKELTDEIKELADFVVYDTPAGVAFPDPVLVAANVGNAVFVHSAGRVPRGSEVEFREKLESVGVQLLGTVLNKVKREDSSGYFHYHRSYQGATGAQMLAPKKAIKN